MLCLSPENASSIGDDTFWLWAERTFPGAQFASPAPGDTVLQYSTLGAVLPGVRGIGLLWELYPEMARVYGGYGEQIAKINECAASCAVNVVPTALVGSLYDCPTQIVPIGVDFDLWKPRSKVLCRQIHNLPANATIGMWCGTIHEMKGYETLRANVELADHWIVVWKTGTPRGEPLDADCTVFEGASQRALSELMSACDFYAVSGSLRPYFLVEYEAMACDAPLLLVGEQDKDFAPTGREGLKRLGWDRKDAWSRWQEILS